MYRKYLNCRPLSVHKPKGILGYNITEENLFFLESTESQDILGKEENLSNPAFDAFQCYIVKSHLSSTRVATGS